MAKAQHIDWRVVRLLVRNNLKRDFRTAGPSVPGQRRRNLPAIVQVFLKFLGLATFVAVFNFIGPIRTDLPERTATQPAAAADAAPASTACLTWSWTDSRVRPAAAGLDEDLADAPATDESKPKVRRIPLDVPTFTFLTLCLSMVMTALNLIVEFTSVVINPEDNELLGPRPISGRTYFVGRLLSMSIYVGVVSLALTLPPAIFGSFLESSSWTYAPAFLVAGLLANLTAAGSVLLIYSVLLRWVSGPRLHDLITYAQIGFIFLVFLGFQMASALANYSTLYIQGGASWWLNFFPMSWFAWLTTLFVWEQAWSSYPYQVHCAVAAALLAPLVVLLGPVRRLSLSYADYLGRLSQSGRGSTGLGPRGWLSGLLDRLIPPAERAGFHFAWAYVRQDRIFKTRFYPSFGMPLAFIAVGLYQGTLGDPFVYGPAQKSFVMYSLSVNLAMAFAISATLSLIPFSESAAACWIYRAAPLASPVPFINGVKKAFSLLFFGPLYVGLYLFFTVLWDSPCHAAIHALLGYGFMLCMLHAASAKLVQEMPFSLLPQRGEVQSRLLSGLMGLMIVSVLFWYWIAYWAYGRGPAVVILLIAVFVAAWLLKRHAEREMHAQVRLADLVV